MNKIFIASVLIICLLSVGTLLYINQNTNTYESINEINKSNDPIIEDNEKEIITQNKDNQVGVLTIDSNINEEESITTTKKELNKNDEKQSIINQPEQVDVNQNNINIDQNNEIENNNNNVKNTVDKIKDNLNNTLDIQEVKNDIVELNSLEVNDQTIKEEISSLSQTGNNILLVDDFINKITTSLIDKSAENISNLKEQINDTKILDIINNMTNKKLQEEFQIKLQNITNSLNNTSSPKVNIVNNKVYEEDVTLNIENANNYKIYLNNEQIQNNYSITNNGNYELLIIDEQNNETKINFSIEKKEIVEEKIEPVVLVRYPMNNWYMTQNFTGKGKHMGIDLSSSNKSEQIYPIADGVVIYVGHDSYGANVVKIKHEINGQQIFSTYAHMKEVYFSPWQTVTKNDLLGLMGATGHATGPHLHLELTTCDWTYNCTYAKYKNSLINPWDILPAN